ncbi:MAG: DEAD/DEAH box helicase, partial [Planctomycetes bacterium]|nr:DEAD/DEAH box helicase [Planctomycetota bacterium]
MSAQSDPASLARGLSWRPAPPPAVFEVPTALAVAPLATNWNQALLTAQNIDVCQLPLTSAAPRVISVAIGRQPVPVRSFAFAPEEDQPAPTKPGSSHSLLRITGSTRIKPPRDVIKLEDRLNYMLQPSLESLLAERSLEFPLQPFSYQLEGVAFLYPRHAAILADEMGLGKTMQAITAIRLLVRSGETARVLLICPKPLVTNWKREFDLWAPEIPTLVIEGDQARRRWQWQLPHMPVKIANYELLHRDRDLFDDGDTSAGSQRHFDLVVLDESQRIKNRASATSQAVRSISRSRNWALTGTPVENSPEDLVGIFEFLAPGVLNSEMRPRRMGRTIRDYVLRRTKDRVLTDLPPKLFRDAELELSPEQYETYRMAEKEGVLRLTELGEAVSIQHVFELVLRLKQIANFDPATGASSKLERLEADLEEIAQSGRKALVFSQWVETLKRLAKRLRRFNPMEYHGSVPMRRRDDVIRQFRDSPDRHVLLMSYGAGGVGLNLQFAGYVFLFDRWWNPAVED